ncbi:MAG: M50 family metallopeptidase [Janthinobacterium lividum]
MIPNRPPAFPPELPQSPSRSALGRLLLATGVSVVLSLVPVASALLYPLRLFVTFIHEGSHALAAALTGGFASQIQVMPDASGVTYTSGGFGPVIVMAGYVGASAYGALMLALARRPGAARHGSCWASQEPSLLCWIFCWCETASAWGGGSRLRWGCFSPPGVFPEKPPS